MTNALSDATSTACDRPPELSPLDERLAENLRRRLALPLPGPRAQRRFETALSYGRHCGPPLAGARPAAVAILLYRHEREWRLPLTVRPATMRWHAGQVSLPGGAIEQGESSGAAALRELFEELGVAIADTELVGQLSALYLYNSHYVVQPWVAVATAAPSFSPSASEVAELLEVPLTHLMDERNVGSHVRSHRGLVFTAPDWRVGRHRVWGATSMILSELVALLGQ